MPDWRRPMTTDAAVEQLYGVRYADVPIVPGGSDRDAVVAWFSMSLEGSSAVQRATAALDRLLADAVGAERQRLSTRLEDYFMRRHEIDPATIASDVLFIVALEDQP